MKRPARSRVEVRGCEIRLGKDLVATACGPKAARLIAEILVVMNGTAVARGRELRSGLVADLLDRADALAAAVFDTLAFSEERKRAPTVIGRAKLRRLVQQYVEIRAYVVSAKRLADYERCKARKHAARAADDDSRDDEDEE